jgi:hypothetical protein
MPIALSNIGWKMYFINGSWDLLIFVAIAIWWIETKGKSLEEIDEAIEGKRYHRDEALGEQVVPPPGYEDDVDKDDDVQIIPAK